MASSPESVHDTKGNQYIIYPNRKIIKVLFIIFRKTSERDLSAHLVLTKAKAFPTAKRKEGKTKSVGVNPCHLACNRGAKVKSQSPAELTIIIKQMVNPRNTSRALNRFMLNYILFGP